MKVELRLGLFWIICQFSLNVKVSDFVCVDKDVTIGGWVDWLSLGF